VLEQPVVEWPVDLELERAQGVGDALDGVGLAVGEVVRRVDAPGIARARVGRVDDAVEDRVAQVDVGRRHVDACAQHPRTVGELAGAHPPEEIEVLLDRAVPPRRRAAGLGQRPAVLPDLLGGQVVDIGVAVPDEVDRPVVELLEVVRREVEVLAPVEAEPADVRLDGVDVLLLLLQGVGVIEPQVTSAAVLVGNAEVQADRLRVADVEVAVGLGREARDDRVVPPVTQVGGHDLADEVAPIG
jgi:hypothetical protein